MKEKFFIEKLNRTQEEFEKAVKRDDDLKGQEYHAERMIEFINGNKPAVLSFTSGPQRQIAYKIEQLKFNLECTKRALEKAKQTLKWYESPIVHTLHIGDSVYEQECFEPTRKATEALKEIESIERGEKK